MVHEGPGVCALFFDLGGVLVDVDLVRLKEGLARLFMVELADVERVVFESGRKTAHDTGQLSSQHFYEELCRELGRQISEIRFVAAWCDLFSERSTATALIPELSGDYRLFACSNTDPLHAGYIRDCFPWAGCFEDAYLSFEAGLAKPDTAYFRGALATFGLEPSQVLFFDDRAENVAAAKSLGILAVQVTDEDSVLAGLSSFGLR